MLSDNINPLASIIVPVYNVEGYLNKCIKSLISQKYCNIEIILIDDGSTDDCPSICDSFSKNDSRIVVIHQENRGLSAARNTGLNASNGEYIFFVDSDDSVTEEFVSSAISIMNDHNADIVCFGGIITDGKEQKGLYYPHKKIKRISSSRAIYMLLTNKIPVDICFKACRRNTIGNLRFPEGYTAECNVLIPQLFDRARRIYLSPALPYYYLRPRPGSIYTERSEKFLSDRIELREKRDLYLKKQHPFVFRIAQETDFRDITLLEFERFVNNYSDNNRDYNVVNSLTQKRLRILLSPFFSLKHKAWIILFSCSPSKAAEVYIGYRQKHEN